MKRLYPGMVVMLLLSAAYITLFQRNLLNNLRGSRRQQSLCMSTTGGRSITVFLILTDSAMNLPLRIYGLWLLKGRII